VASRRRGLSSLARLAPLGAFSGLGAFAVVDGATLLALLSGAGISVAAGRLLRRRGDSRGELRRLVDENARELGRVAREDRISASQMERLGGLQRSLVETWELLPEEYGPLLAGDIFTIVAEVEGAARLARRRAALRRHLESTDRRGILRRIKGLEKDLKGLEPGSPLRAPFESALESRRAELEGHEDILNGISMINAQLEGVESLLSGLRGELLALDSGSATRPVEPELAAIRERISYFRRSLEDVARTVDPLPDPAAERMPAR
jgi:hypothetical protein